MNSNNINYAEAARCHLHANSNIGQNNDGSMGEDAPMLYSNISLHTMQMMSLMEQVNGSTEMRPDVQVSPYHTTSVWSLPNAKHYTTKYAVDEWMDESVRHANSALMV